MSQIRVKWVYLIPLLDWKPELYESFPYYLPDWRPH